MEAIMDDSTPLQNEHLDDQGNIPINMWLKLSERYYKSKNWWESLKCLDKLLMRDPECVQGLVMRSNCFMNLHKYDEARVDIEKAMELDDNDSEVLHQMAEFRYMSGDYGDSFKAFSKAAKLFPTLQRNWEGMRACQRSILRGFDREEVVADIDYLDFQKSIFHCEEKKKKVRKEVCYSCKMVNIYGKTKRSKEELKIAVNDRNLCEHLKEVYPSVLKHYLEHSTPVQVPKTSPNVKHDDSHMIQEKQSMDSHDVYLQVRRCIDLSYHALKKGNYIECVKEANHVLKLLNSVAEEVMPMKQRFRANAFNLMGKAYHKQGCLKEALTSHKKEDFVFKNNHLLNQRHRSLRNLGDVYYSMEDYGEAVLCFLDALEFANEMYTIHKLGLCYMQLGELAEAEKWALLCLSGAEEMKDEKWEFDSYVLLAAIAVKCDDHVKTLEFIDKAIQKTSVIGDNALEHISLDILTKLYGDEPTDEDAKEVMRDLRRKTVIPEERPKGNLKTAAPVCASREEYSTSHPDTYSTYSRVRDCLKAAVRAWEEGNYAQCLEKALELLKMISSVREELLPGKSRYKIHALMLIGKVYRKSGETDTAEAFEEIEGAVRRMNEMFSFRGRFLSYLTGNYADILSLRDNLNRVEEMAGHLGDAGPQREEGRNGSGALNEKM